MAHLSPESSIPKTEEDAVDGIGIADQFVLAYRELGKTKLEMLEIVDAKVFAPKTSQRIKEILQSVDDI